MGFCEREKGRDGKPTFLSVILAETLMIRRSNPQEELRAKHFVRREERLTDSGN